VHLVTDGHTFEESVDLVVAAIHDAAAVAAHPVAAKPALAAKPAVAAKPARSGASASPAPGAPARRNRILEIAMRMDNEQTLFIRVLALLSRIFARILARIEVDGVGNVPRQGAVILAVNHISNIDPFVAGAWVSATMHTRRIHWLGKRELFDWPVFGWICALGGVHPVDRGAADIEAYRLATRILESGYVLVIFPEGTRSPTGGLQEAKDGLTMLAMRTGAQIVPIGVNNTDAVWKKGKKLPSPFPRKTVTVHIGTPFRIEDVVPAGTPRKAAKAIATTAIMGRIAELLDPRHRGVYAEDIRTLPTTER